MALEVKEFESSWLFQECKFFRQKRRNPWTDRISRSGRSEVCQAVCGVTEYDSGEVFLNEKPVRFHHPAQAMKKKLGYLPEDRQIQGLLLPWEIYKNATLSSLE